MTTPVIPKEILQRLKCINCNLYLSIGPVNQVLKGYFCGRCSDAEGVSVTIYEELAKFPLFPCIYDEFGCKKAFPFGEDTIAHETRCIYKPKTCPFDNCDWQGTFEKVLEHADEIHRNALKKARVKLNLLSNTKDRYMLTSQGLAFAVDVIYNAEKGLSIQVMQLFPKTVASASKCNVSICHPDGSSLISFNQNVVECDGQLKTSIYPELLQNSGRDYVFINFAPQWDMLAKATTSLFAACKNFKFGCSFMGTINEIKTHDAACKVYDCPLKCKSCTSKCININQHCIEKHKPSCYGFSFSVQQIVSQQVPQFNVFYTSSNSNLLYLLCFKYIMIEQLLYVAVQSLAASGAMKQILVQFQLGSLSIEKAIPVKPFTNEDNPFDNCVGFFCENLLESNILYHTKS